MELRAVKIFAADDGGESVAMRARCKRARVHRRDVAMHEIGLRIVGIAQAALDFQAEGYSVLSLSGAPLARTEECPGPARTDVAAARPDPLDRLLDLVGTRLEPVYGFRSLLRFKAKFQPELRPMYLIYADAAALPAIGRAVARAYVPDASLGMLLRLFNRLMLGSARGSTADTHAAIATQASATPDEPIPPEVQTHDPIEPATVRISTSTRP